MSSQICADCERLRWSRRSSLGKWGESRKRSSQGHGTVNCGRMRLGSDAVCALHWHLYARCHTHAYSLSLELPSCQLLFQCSLIIPRLEGLSLQGLLNFFNVPRKNPSPSFSLSQANMAQFTHTLSLTPPPPGWTRNPSSVYVIRDMIRWTTHIYLQ